jgi:hypothetical protein
VAHGNAGSQIGAESLYRKYFPNPNGDNAYEEYFQAADLVQSASFQAFAQFAARLDQEQRGTPPLDQRGKPLPWPNPPPGLSRDSTYLEVRREWVKRFRRLADLIKAGNVKPALDPRTVADGPNAVPKMIALMDAAKFLATVAYVDYADGGSQAGTEDLLQDLAFASALGGGTMLHTLCEYAIQGIVVDEFARDLSQISEPGAKRIIAAVERLQKPGTSLSSALEASRRAIPSRFEFLRDPDTALSKVEKGGPEEQQLKFVAAMTPSERTALAETITSRMNRLFDKLLWVAKGSESGWLQESCLEAPGPELRAPSKWSSPDDVADYVVSLWNVSRASLFRHALLARTRIRLLRLHAQVILYRWHHRQLPMTLKDVASEADRFDPSNGKEFKYQLVPSGYRLTSEGFKDTGEIELQGADQAPVRNAANPPPSLIGSP